MFRLQNHLQAQHIFIEVNIYYNATNVMDEISSYINAEVLQDVIYIKNGA
jgi:hypothetical protein